jgi:hypothetical protein
VQAARILVFEFTTPCFSNDSNYNGVQYVTLQMKIGWRFSSAKWFWHSIFAQFAEAGKRHSKA